MSRSAEALPSSEASDLSNCPRCARLYHPPHVDGCWRCRRLKTSGPRLVTPEKSTDQLEREEHAEADTYDFLDAFHGYPDAD